MLLSGLGAGLLYAAAADRPPAERPAADPEAVDLYLAQLSETVPPPVATRLARRESPADSAEVKDPTKANRAEAIVETAFSVLR